MNSSNIISAMRSLFSWVFHAGSVTSTGCSEISHRITSLKAWEIRGEIGLKSLTSTLVNESFDCNA
jgi:hypothetical protein